MIYLNLSSLAVIREHTVLWLGQVHRMTSDASYPLLAEKLRGSISMADSRQLPGAGKVGCREEPGALH